MPQAQVEDIVYQLILTKMSDGPGMSTGISLTGAFASCPLPTRTAARWFLGMSTVDMLGAVDGQVTQRSGSCWNVGKVEGVNDAKQHKGYFVQRAGGAPRGKGDTARCQSPLTFHWLSRECVHDMEK
jgi:hypothetical protein